MYTLTAAVGPTVPMAATDSQPAAGDDDEFQDAVEEQAVFTLPEHHGPMTLERSLDECRLAVRYFFNNQFDEAREIMRPWRDSSMYHAMGYGTMLYLQAIMTFDPRDIEVAVDVLRSSVEVCNRFRRKSTLGETVSKIVKKPDYGLYTEEEAHAELCYAKCLLLRAVLNFVEDETLISLVKGGLKVKTCYTCYRDCWQMLKHRDWTGSKTKQHFEGGVRLGVGTFNLMISQLPAKILKLLEFVGFTGNKDIGLRELETGFSLTESIHRSLCSLVLLGYHLVATYFMSNSEGDLVASERILSEQLVTYPNGAFFLFFAGRLELVRGHFERSAQLYRESWQSQRCWTQFHHVCFWELFWNNVFLSQWEEAAEFAGLLLRESRWSRTIYSYLRAASLLMLAEQSPGEDSQRQEINTLMNTLPDFKQRIAGKSVPAEKFVIRKSRRYLAQGGRLLMPGYELLYLWNGFKILRKRRHLVEDVFSEVEHELAALDNKAAASEFAADERALLLLLRGVCLVHLSSPLQAEEALLAVTRLQSQLRDDHYLVPFAWLELGLLALQAGRTEDAVKILEHAKSGYKGYNMINRLHFRVHAAMGAIAASKSGSATPDPLTAPDENGCDDAAAGTDDDL
ncbi:tetratricopeptide repeat protein 39B-like isoform X3 [Amphibalanus amphitrite]|uniref:tetratricopeptide repeat protein 39B-like isoform X3 n=1 Tax=Amphibalanus amphitrite TaxID=1232801 RepID=UPI001C925297|nr:tetratricopeptide repeat protein 39B-like isoform X3 [Amphibalanus amphitrite]